VVQALPSLHAVPFATFVATQPVAGLQLSAVQGLLSLHTTAVPAHTPAVHWSPAVHALPSVQPVPFGTGVVTQPVAGLQPSVVHWFPSLQTIAVPAQTPALHWSPEVQAVPSLQTVPFGTLVMVHPVAGLQLSVVHALPSLQTTAVPVQTPLRHWSPEVQRLPSLQIVPFATLVVVQPVPGLQPSTVHPFPSLQTISVPPQIPAVH
jgi:hypothetical protein